MSEGIAVLYKALAAAQSEFPNIEFDAKSKIKGETKSGKAFEYDHEYATLANIIASICPALNKHGLFLSQDTWTGEDGATHHVKTRLMHESGQTFESGVMSARPIQGGMQAIGGIIAYMKRYQIAAFLGLSVGEKEDDDGAREEEVKAKSDDRRNGVAMPREKAPEPSASKEPPQEPAKGGAQTTTMLTDGAKRTLRAAMERASVDDAKLKELTGYVVDEMPFAELNGAMKSLREQPK